MSVPVTQMGAVNTIVVICKDGIEYKKILWARDRHCICYGSASIDIFNLYCSGNISHRLQNKFKRSFPKGKV